MATKLLTLSDGRKLDYYVGGAPDGLPFVFIHGTPGSYPVIPELERACEKKKLKLITFSRSGYGNSTRHKGRKVVDQVQDVSALLQHLGHERCVVGGWSGGGPHALACAARLKGCAAVLSVASAGPYGEPDLDFWTGLGEGNVKEFTAALKGEGELRTFCEEERVNMLQADARTLTDALSSLLPPVDKKAILESQEMGELLVASMGEALKTNCDGWIDDDLAFLGPWGFDYSEIKCPVFFYQGSEDLMVPFQQGQWLARHIPKEYITAHLLQGEGHISIFLGRINEMLDQLLDAANTSSK